jgi:phenylacetate-CoA ligase
MKSIQGSAVPIHLKWLEANQYHALTTNTREQTRRLQESVARSFQTVPYYRMISGQYDWQPISPSLPLEAFWERFHKLPVLRREELQVIGAGLTSAMQDGPVRVLPTSGTTGTVVRTYQDQASWDWYQAQIRFFYQWAGLSVGTPHFYLWGTPRDFTYQSTSHWKSVCHALWMQHIQCQHVMNCRTMSEDRMAAYIRQINAHPGIRHLSAYTHELYQLACFSLDHNLPIRHSFQGILVTTARLTEPMRQTIEVVFHCPVQSRYGSREFGDLACECHFQNGYHINPFYAYVEVVDEAGQPLPYGEVGRIVVTSLKNAYMPLIRYEIGDMGVMREPAYCRCGRSWPTLESIAGRIHESILLPDGATVGSVFINYALEYLNDVRCYQLHQVDATTLEVQFVSMLSNYVDTHPEGIAFAKKRLEEVTHFQMTIRFRQVETLQRSSSGKTPLIVSYLGSQYEETVGEPRLLEPVPAV